MPLTKANKTSFKNGSKPWNAGKKLPDWYRKKLSDSRLASKYCTGELHPRWKGGNRGYYNDLAAKNLTSIGTKKICLLCGDNDDIHVHHIDRNWKNNDVNNLQFLCISCHIKKHHEEDRRECVCRNCGKTFFSGRKKKIECGVKCHNEYWRKRNKVNISN
jgi:hypothetical protein